MQNDLAVRFGAFADLLSNDLSTIEIRWYKYRWNYQKGQSERKTSVMAYNHISKHLHKDT